MKRCVVFRPIARQLVATVDMIATAHSSAWNIATAQKLPSHWAA
jgi:hypothetical protein